MFEDIQKEWESLFNRHRLTFVTTISDEMVDKLDELNLYYATVEGKTGSNRTLYLKNKLGKIEILLVEDEDGAIVTIEDEDTLFIDYDYGKMYTTDYIKKEEAEKLIPFMEELIPFIKTASDKYHEHYEKDRKKQFEEKYSGVTVETIVWIENETPHFVLSNGELVEVTDAYNKLTQEYDRRKN